MELVSRAFQKNPVWVIVPAKSLSQAKSRLSSALSPQQRMELVTRLLQHTLEVLHNLIKVGELAGILVISSDPLILDEAQKYGALILEEESGSETERLSESEHLNKALLTATSWLFAHQSVNRLLILPVDLPLLNEISLRALLSLSTDASAVITTDQSGTGTNVLLLPAGLARDFPYSFGLGSFQAHRQIILDRGVNLKEAALPDLMFDLDQTKDLVRLPTRLKEDLW
ncbi:MAG TPA: 2-phospho-L-lactate guanylyltransferase [Chloroflexia bacterium]|nr:2-phospho-L-lactate guanylyltransferase [Chloroflexia bacterium]